MSVKPTFLSFLDSQVSTLISEKYGFTEMDALRFFVKSQTYQMLIDEETELYKSSPYILFDMWECEKITGDPRTSVYIREE